MWNTYNIIVIVGLYKNELLNTALNIFLFTAQKTNE